MPGILVFFHNPSNSGFASKRHEVTFTKMAYRLVGDYNKIHFAYKNLDLGRSKTLPGEIINVIEFDSAVKCHKKMKMIHDYIFDNDIKIGFGFDQPVRRPAYKCLRKAGMRYLISYCGSPMSSINSGLKLFAKKLDVACSFYRPDHYIFQSEGMRKTATHGRGIPFQSTSVVLSGTDTELFRPAETMDWYAHDTFGIARQQKIIFFSGNMEERKGVDVIIRAADELVNVRQRRDVHFLLVGNRWDQEKRLLRIVENSTAADHVTFGGYRSDVPQILKSCYLGMIASTGWDSYPMSAVEMAATGMPVIVSDLPGLREVITEDTGFHFPVGNYLLAADRAAQLLDDQTLRARMGRAARNRVLQGQTIEHQIAGLELVIRSVAGDLLGGL